MVSGILGYRAALSPIFQLEGLGFLIPQWNLTPSSKPWKIGPSEGGLSIPLGHQHPCCSKGEAFQTDVFFYLETGYDEGLVPGGW